MYKGNRYLFYDIESGEVLINEARSDSRHMPTIEKVIETYTQLSERNRDTFDVLVLRYTDYAQDFAECSGYRVNPETKTLEFSYHNPNEPEAEQPYQAPLSEKVAQLEQENRLLKAQNNVLAERTDFHEEVLSEIILTITS